MPEARPPGSHGLGALERASSEQIAGAAGASKRPAEEAAPASSAATLSSRRGTSVPALKALELLTHQMSSPTASSSAGDSGTPSTAATLAPRRAPRANVFSLGNGGYRSLYLQAVSKVDCLETVEDPGEDDCDIHFIVPIDRDKLVGRLSKLRAGSCVNHFPGMIDLCEKVTFCRVIRQASLLCPRLDAFVPATRLLPEELPLALAALDDASKTGKGARACIVKPEYGLQGHGIFIARTRADLEVALAARGGAPKSRSRYVCQDYISNPLTLQGLKFDLRLYVVLTSLAPLRAHLCREGIARFCTTRYEPPNAKNINVRTGHLTNYALNSREVGFARGEAGASMEDASKRLLSTTLSQIGIETGGRFQEDLFWTQVEEIVSLLMVALLPGLGVNASQYFPVKEGEPCRCYHVLGLDVLLDTNLWPWLLEVNSSPAMDIETAVPAPADLAAPRGAAAGKPAAAHGGAQRSPAAAAARRSTGSLPSPAAGAEKGAEGPKVRRKRKESCATDKKLPGGEGAATCAASRAGATTSSASLLGGSGHLAAAAAADADRCLSRTASLPARLKPRGRSNVMVAPQQELLPGAPKYTDPWEGYRPSKLRQRRPWPEVCHCTAHSLPHQHSVCEVDDKAKTLAMVGALQLALGWEVDHGVYKRIRLTQELERVALAMQGFVALCGHLRNTRWGLGWRSLRRALQAVEDTTGLGKYGLDLLAAPACEVPNARRSRQLARGDAQERSGGAEEMSSLALLATVIEVSRKCCQRDPQLCSAPPLAQVSRKCCQRDPQLCSAPPLAQLEWLLQLLGDRPTAAERCPNKEEPMRAAAPAAAPPLPITPPALPCEPQAPESGRGSEAYSARRRPPLQGATSPLTGRQRGGPLARIGQAALMPL